MTNLDLAELRPKLDLEGKYVDFGFIRSTLTIEKLVCDLQINLPAPTKENERRGRCPKCQKERSFSLNTATSRFVCFAKGCQFKGGGVIDFFAKFNEVSAKEALHLLACAYGFQPYTGEPILENQKIENVPPDSAATTFENAEQNEKTTTVTRAEMVALEQKVERLTNLVWSLMFENDLRNQFIEDDEKRFLRNSG